MENVNYELPEDIGTVSFSVPSAWVGARSAGVEALWIDQFAEGFENNVTLKIRKVSRALDSEELLDQYIRSLVSETDATPVSNVSKSAGRRQISFCTQVFEYKLCLDHLVLYAGTESGSYLIVLCCSQHADANVVSVDGAVLSAQEMQIH